LIIFSFFIILYFHSELKNFIKNDYRDNNEHNFYLNETIYQAALNSRDFVIHTNEGILTKPIPLEIKENPLISVIIPMFNAENFINRAIRSIQNQNYSNFEIMVVNDFSSDNSLNIVKQSSKNDKRIKIINNAKKMGNLYSRCIGTIMSKGKYIFPLDADDMMIASDSLYVIQKEAEQKTILYK
jgi:cellulose synthase/poly-beta-1,6-N-acetylglucosamine synthase-like glycosyltransferase